MLCGIILGIIPFDSWLHMRSQSHNDPGRLRSPGMANLSPDEGVGRQGFCYTSMDA